MASEPSAGRGNHSLFNDKTLSDVTVKFCNQEVYAHKSILARKSEYFYKAFTGGFPVASSDQVDLGDDDDDADSIRAMLRHIYDIHYDQLIEDEHPTAAYSVNEDLMFHVNVFTAADKYDVPSLREKVITKFNNLMESNWESVEFIASIKTLCGPSASHFADKSLQAAAATFCAKHVMQLVKKEEFVGLLEEGEPFAGRLLTGFLAGTRATEHMLYACQDCMAKSDLDDISLKQECCHCKLSSKVQYRYNSYHVAAKLEQWKKVILL